MLFSILLLLLFEELLQDLLARVVNIDSFLFFYELMSLLPYLLEFLISSMLYMASILIWKTVLCFLSSLIFAQNNFIL
jgi:hypothetical protein